MKGFIGSFGLWPFLLFLWDQRKKKPKKHLSASQADYSLLDSCDSENDHKKKMNLVNVSRVVDQYKDYTAEVISINIFGKNKVEKFRLLNPGDKVELRYIHDEIKVYSFGRFIADLIPDASSRLREVMSKGIPYHSYLGGRDMALMNLDSYDSCSIIVFYKMEGVPPTKVLIK